jgi:serine protease
VLCGTVSAQEPTDRLIVKYRDTGASTMATRQAALPADRLGRMQAHAWSFGARARLLRHTALGAHVLALDRKLNPRDAQALAAALHAADPNVEYAEPDYVLQPQFVPNDRSFGSQWSLFEAAGGIRAANAWDLSTGSRVVVAVLDSGYRPHADLAPNIIEGFDFVTDTAKGSDGDGRDRDARDPGNANAAGECGADSTASDSGWHGTLVGGVVAARADNGLGIAGIAFESKVLPVRVLGKCGGFTSDIADGIVWASGAPVTGVPSNTHPARVINLSLAGGGTCSVTLQNAIDTARSRHAVVVAAAGNANSSAAFQPASCAGVISVAATDRFGARAFYSNFGSTVALAAPGGDQSGSTSNGILSTSNTGLVGPGADTEKFVQGTSFAAPHVAAVAALMISRNAALTPDQVKRRLTSSARDFPGACDGCGAGLLDAFAAVQAASAVIVNETEPNNERASANAIAASALVKGAIGSGTDTDFYKVELPPGKTLHATLIASEPGARYELVAFDGNGRQIAISQLGAGKTQTLSVTNQNAVTFKRYVQVRYAGGPTGSSRGRYVLDIKF